MKFLFLLTLTNIVCQCCFSQDNHKTDNLNCYQEKIKWNTRDKNFKDTTLFFRNYIDNKKDKRIICKRKLFDKDIENLIWNCKYISVHLQYLEQLNRFAFISYDKLDKENTVVSFYLCGSKNKESVEMTTFKVAHNKITGIIVLPLIIKEFTPIEEYDNHKTGRID